MILHTETSKLMYNLCFLLVVLHKPTLLPSTFQERNRQFFHPHGTKTGVKITKFSLSCISVSKATCSVMFTLPPVNWQLANEIVTAVEISSLFQQFLNTLGSWRVSWRSRSTWCNPWHPVWRSPCPPQSRHSDALAVPPASCVVQRYYQFMDQWKSDTRISESAVQRLVFQC